MSIKYRDDVAFFIWCHDDSWQLNECLGTFFDSTYGKIDLFGVVNDCNDNTAEVFKSFGMSYCELYPQASISACVNVGYEELRRQNFKYLGWIHPDCTFLQPGWVDFMIEDYNKWPNIGRISARNGLHPKDGEYMIRQGAEAGTIITSDVWDDVGPYDEHFIGCGGYEDWDWITRLVQKGYNCVQTERALVNHHHAQTRLRVPALERVEYWRNNNIYYNNKWGNDDAPKFLRDDFRQVPYDDSMPTQT